MLRQFGKTNKSFKKTLILFATTLLRFMDGLWMAQLHTNKSLINIQNDLKDAQTSKRATFVTIMCRNGYCLLTD